MMNVYRNALLVIGLGSGLLSMGAHAEQKENTVSDANRIHISITGSPETRYSARWRVTQNGEIQEYQEDNGTVPADYTYEGEALEGTVSMLSAGRLEVDIAKGGNRSRSATQGKGGTLQINVSGS